MFSFAPALLVFCQSIWASPGLQNRSTCCSVVPFCRVPPGQQVRQAPPAKATDFVAFSSFLLARSQGSTSAVFPWTAACRVSTPSTPPNRVSPWPRAFTLRCSACCPANRAGLQGRRCRRVRGMRSRESGWLAHGAAPGAGDTTQGARAARRCKPAQPADGVDVLEVGRRAGRRACRHCLLHRLLLRHQARCAAPPAEQERRVIRRPDAGCSHCLHLLPRKHRSCSSRSL